MKEKECETLWNDYQQLLEQQYCGTNSNQNSRNGSLAETEPMTSMQWMMETASSQDTTELKKQSCLSNIPKSSDHSQQASQLSDALRLTHSQLENKITEKKQMEEENQ